MDASLYRAINRLATRTGWAHPLFIAYAKYGVLVFAVLLLAGWWLARSQADTTPLPQLCGPAPLRWSPSASVSSTGSWSGLPTYLVGNPLGPDSPIVQKGKEPPRGLLFPRRAEGGI
ncbi:MAG: hypothetical protein QOD57_233 [Actinomycetota bacterium]|nr:hypothetical protein [Actinomycetota bacterium]